MTHPSYLELDRHALGESSDALRMHLAACDLCSSHLARLQAPSPLPDWARVQEAPPRRLRFAWVGAFACAAAAVLVIAILPGDRNAPPPYLAAKGMPSVAIYVLRDGRTALWNGTDALRPGDRIRLKVAPEGHRWLAVSARDERGRLRTLHEARITGSDDYVLPESWRIDAAPGPERLHVALDGAPVDPARAAWTTTLELPKEAP